ncbi:MAG: LemA family protein [bacterium]|nr:LemA family protein [bacterium]
MKKGCLVGIVIVVVIIGFIGFFIGGLNKVVRMDENVKAAWAQVENQLQRRNDLIPNLVNTVKGYAKHEKEIFTYVADARGKLAGTIKGNKSIKEKIQAAGELNTAISRLLMIVERYPDLKANESFARLMDELSGTENRIAVERMRYNRGVQEFNAHIRMIPGSFFARLKGLSKAEYFEVEEKAKEVPVVKF